MNSSDVLNSLASSLGSNSDVPNVNLAIEICDSKDTGAVKVLVDSLTDSRSALVNDCMNVLYEIGERSPMLISEHVSVFIQLLSSGNNRLVRGGITALAQIVHFKPAEIFAQIDTVIRAYEEGVVVTRDQSIIIFAELCHLNATYEAVLFPIILNHLENCEPKEIPVQALRSFVAVNEGNAAAFRSVLEKRIDLLSDLNRKRIARLIHSIGR